MDRVTHPGGVWRRSGRRLAEALLTLAVPVVVIAVCIHLLASATFLRLEYGRPGFPAAPGFTDEARLALAVPSTRFVVRDREPEQLRALTHDGTALYTEQEIAHLVDVQRLVRTVTRLALLAAAWIVVAGIASGWRGRGGGLQAWRAATARGGWLTLVLVASVGGAIAVAWPLFFVGFHRVFFAPGTWQFPMDSGLIRLFPERFWFDVAAAFALLAAIQGILVARLVRP